MCVLNYIKFQSQSASQSAEGIKAQLDPRLAEGRTSAFCPLSHPVASLFVCTLLSKD